MHDTQRLCRKLNYTFKDGAYLKHALTHRSAAEKNNERLEFLGDSIVNMVIARALFEQFPTQHEGELSRLRAHLVSGDMLATIAIELALGDYLYLGQGELKSGGFRRASILADALEAVIAAIFLDSNFDTCQTVILHLYESRLQDKALCDRVKDAKTELQEYLQAKKIPLPRYELTHVTGEEHEQIFHVTCDVQTLAITTHGKAETRRKAEQIAAKEFLNQLLKI